MMRHTKTCHWVSILVIILVLVIVPAGLVDAQRDSLNLDTEPTGGGPAQPDERLESGLSLRMVGQVGGRTEDVAVQGDYAYVAVGLRLVVLDVSDPTAPAEIGSTMPFSEFVEGVTVSGSLAYVAAGTAGLWIVDISDPAQPAEIGAYDTPG